MCNLQIAPRVLVWGYQHIRGTYFVHIQGTFIDTRTSIFVCDMSSQWRNTFSWEIVLYFSKYNTVCATRFDNKEPAILPTEGDLCWLWQRLFPQDSVNSFVFKRIKDTDSLLCDLEQEFMSVSGNNILSAIICGPLSNTPTCSSNHKRGITRIGEGNWPCDV